MIYYVLYLLGLYEYEKKEEEEKKDDIINYIVETYSDDEVMEIKKKVIKYSDVIDELKIKIKDRFISD